MATVKSVSATQIKQFRGCALQWYLQRVEGWEYPQSESQALGEQVHGQVERYMLGGATEDLLPSVDNAIKKKLIPNYGEQDGRIVEEPKDYGMRMALAGVPVKGRIDLLLPPPPGTSKVMVVDWKTTKTFAYTPKVDDLTRDVQGVLYLRYAFEQYPFATEGQFRHVYLLTKGTGSKKVDADVVDRAFVDGQWQHLEQTVEVMKETAGRSLPVVTKNQANLGNCDAYGGCKFRDRCPAASKGLVQAMFDAEVQAPAKEEGPMSALAEKLRARRAAAVAAEAPVAPAPEPVVVVEVPVVPEPVVLPPDAPKAAASDEANDTPPVPRRRPAFAKKATAPVVEASVPVVVSEPTGVEVEVPVVETFVVDRTPDPDVVAAAATVREQWIAEGEKRPLALYIDCYPEKAEFESLRALEDEIASRTPTILEHLRRTSPKDVPENAVDLGEVLFGRGYSTLSASFVLRPLSGPWTVSTHGPASSKVLEVLLPKATFVVRGRR